LRKSSSYRISPGRKRTDPALGRGPGMVGGGGRIHRPRRHQMMRTASTRRTTVQDLDLEMGRPSAISTVSPSLYWLASSCALYLAVRFTSLPSTGCFTRVWTLTTTVLSILLLTTLPTSVR